MSAAQLAEVVNAIKRLSPQERDRVQEQLDALREVEFVALRDKARMQAAAEGVDDNAIDMAVEKVRYGR